MMSIYTAAEALHGKNEIVVFDKIISKHLLLAQDENARKSPYATDGKENLRKVCHFD